MILLTLLLLGLAAPSYADLRLQEGLSYEHYSLNPFMQYYHDPDNTLQVEDLLRGQKATDFRPFETDSPIMGFRVGSFWVRLTITNESNTTRTMVIESRWALTDHVDFFHINAEGQIDTALMGDHGSFNTRKLPYRFPAAEYKLDPGTHQFYIRYETEGTAILSSAIWDQAPFFNHVRNSYAYIGLLFGFFVVMFFYTIFLFFSFRSRSYLYYAIYLVAFSFSQLGYQGLALEWMPEPWGIWGQNKGFVYSLQMTSLFGLLFAMSFLNMRTLMPRIFRVTQFLCAYLIVFAIALPLLSYKIAALTINLSVMFFCLGLLATGIYAIALGYRPAIFYTVGWAVFLSGNLALTLKMIGLFPDNSFSDNPLLFAAIEVVLMSLALADRMKFINAQAEKEIRDLNTTLQQHILKVEDIVAERTRTISTIIDNVQSGFLMIDRDLNVGRGFTKSCHHIFRGNLREGIKITDVFPLDPDDRQILRMALEQVFADRMPEDVAVSQVPSLFQLGDSSLRFDWSIVRGDDGAIRLLLITVQDVTALREKEREAQRSQMLFKIVSNLEAFRTLLQHAKVEAERLESWKGEGWDDELRRFLHTLKGNCLVFSLQDLAESLHELEEAEPSPQILAQVRELFERFLERYQRELHLHWSHVSQQTFKIQEQDVQLLRRETQGLTSHHQFQGAIERWLNQVTSKTLRDLLGPIEEDVQSLAQRLHKEVHFEVTGDHFRITSQPLQDFVMSLIHIIRNAVIHGLEEDRKQAGKSPAGLIQLDLRQTAEGVLLTLSDDGRGIDRLQLESKVCKERNLDPISVAAMSLDQLIRSTRNSSPTSELSLYAGRGLGLAAVLDMAERTHCRVRIESNPGKGTRFVFLLPETASLLQAS